MRAALLYEYALALQGLVEGLLVDWTRGGDLMLSRRINIASIVPPLGPGMGCALAVAMS